MLLPLIPLVLCSPASVRPLQDAPKEPPREEAPRGLRLREPEAFDGYTLISPLNSLMVHLVDMRGEVVHTWTTEHAPAGGAYLLDNGHLLRCARKPDNPRFHGGGIGGLVQELDWNGEIVWEFELAGEHLTSHHDLELLPDGNVLIIAWEHHPPEEAIAAGREPRFAHKEGLWSDVVLEVRPTRPRGGETVWQWRAWDHLVQDTDPALPRHGRPEDHPGRIDINADHRHLRPVESDKERRERLRLEAEMRRLGYAGGGSPPADPGDDPAARIKADWLHTNAVAYDAEHDLIVLSTPHLSEVWVIDHGTTTAEAAGSTGGRRGKGGELLYRWGNPRAWGMGGEAERRLYRQHDPTWQRGPAGELALLVFNNGGGRPGGDHSSVDLLLLPFDPATGFTREQGRPFGPAAPAWSYADKNGFFSAFISGAQRLPGGNVLICAGAPGRVFEVTPDKRVVWDFLNPLGGDIEPSPQGGRAPPKALFRATRLPVDHPGIRAHLGTR